MIISHKHKFILLHAGKCAGSSIRICLNNIIKEPKLKIKTHHPTLCECQAIVKNSNIDPMEYKIIGMVRNPFDRMVSWYYHSLYKSKTHTGTFEEFLNRRLTGKSENLIPPYIKCDHIIRYEYLQADFDTFLNLINLTPHELPHINKNPNKPTDHYRTMYTEKTKQMTSNYFALVIEMFGYKF
jgi:hypothetical protein